MSLFTRRTLLQALLAQGLPSGTADAQAVVHREPRPLAPDAVTHDWTAFLGPSHNAVSTETPLRRFLPPPLVWEWPTGIGYASPAVAGDRLLFIHRLGDEEVVECRHAETGASHWRFRYPTGFEDLHGLNNGPRASPIIDGDRVFTVGAEGKLHCLDLETGDVVWRQDFWVKYGVTKEPYGTASTPLVEGGLLVVNVGGQRGACVVGLDTATGREAWRAGTWGPSYASPVPATVHGRRRVFVLAGGLSNPPTGGLLSIDPATGAVDFTVSHRSREYLSASASSPVVIGDKVFISASQRAGGALVEIRPDFTHRVVWTTENFALFFNTPIHRDGYLYGIDGETQGDSSLACIDTATGQIVWREARTWTETFQLTGRMRQLGVGAARASLLAADGQFLCLGEFGHLLWLDLTPKGFGEVSRAWLFAARQSFTPPVLSRGLLYVTQNTRDFLTGDPPRLLCYDLRGGGTARPRERAQRRK